MSNEKSSQEAGLTFIWKIENYSSVCVSASIASPTFVAKTLDDTQWYLTLSVTSFFRRSSFGSGYIKREGTVDGPEIIKVNTSISCASEDGELLIMKQSEEHEFRKHSCQSFSLDGFEEKEKSAFLPNDTLTIRCRMWRSDVESTLAEQYCARSRLGTIRMLNIWTVDPSIGYWGKNQTFSLHSGSKEDPSLKLSGFLAKSSGYFHIEVVANKVYFVNGKISLLNADGKPGKLSTSCSCTLNSLNAYHFPNFIHKSSFGCGKLSLLCDFTIFNGKDFCAIEEINFLPSLYRNLDEHYLDTYEPYKGKEYPTCGRFLCDRGSQTAEPRMSEQEFSEQQFATEVEKPPSSNCSPEQETERSLQSDMLSLFTEKKFCDLILKAGDQKFPVHKAVLCARSPTFRALLTDLEAKKTAGIDIYKGLKQVEVMDGTRVYSVESIEKNVPVEHMPEKKVTTEDLCDINKTVACGVDNNEKKIDIEGKEETTSRPLGEKGERKCFSDHEPEADVMVLYDIHPFTLNQLLSFMYTDTVVDIQAKDAAALYSASIRYGVSALKDKCLSIIETTLSVSNVCDVILVLEDPLCKDIEKIVGNFFLMHANEILKLEAWQDLIEDALFYF